MAFFDIKILCYFILLNPHLIHVQIGNINGCFAFSYIEAKTVPEETVDNSPQNMKHQSNTNTSLSQKHVRDHYHDYEEDLYRAEVESAECGFSCEKEEICIPANKVCDNFVDCIDSSDENNCDCKERIGLKKLCDGFADCPDAEDEEGCGGCADDEFACNAFERDVSRVKCIPKNKVCDGQSDCSSHEDEENCFRLLPFQQNAPAGVRSTGILQKRIGDEWFIICKGGKSESILSHYVEKTCNSIVGKTTISAHYSNKIVSARISKLVKNKNFALLGETESKFTTIESQCPSKSVITVDCPDPECGWPADGRPPSTRSKRHSDHVEDIDKLSELTAKIVGGQDSLAGSWPSLVGIYRNGSFHCGGSLIDSQWVLTAAHCFHSYEKYVFEIQAGMLRRFSWSPTEQARQVTHVFIHERYDSKIFLNDIALMKLDRPIYLSKWVKTACLVRSDQVHLDPHPDQLCIVSGWGDLAEGKRGPDQMQQVSLPVLAKCVETFTKDTAQICAGLKEGGHDACQGDSGGPFACNDDTGRHILAGIVSFGRGCARPNQPGVYTRVSHYTAWIDSVLAGTNHIVKTQTPPIQCGHGKCRRSGGECLFPKMECDRKVDCLDGSDEMDCDFSNIENFHAAEVHIDQRAFSDVVIASHGREEHVHDYGSAKLCGPTEFQCARTKSCVPEGLRCDGTPDCSDSTDEMHCGCGTIITNRFPTLKCDFFKNCVDGSDESDSECNYCNGTQNQIKCPLSDKCILQQKWCDGTKNCPDGEDEVDCIRIARLKSLNQLPDFLGDKISRGLQSGFVVTREKGKTWSPACEDETEESMADIICPYLGFSLPSPSPRVSLSRTRRSSRVYNPRPFPKPNIEIWGRSYDTQDDTNENSNERNCTLAKVTCGEVNCGIEKLYSRSRRNPPAIELGAQPWFTVVTVDGKPKCGATLVNKNWIIASSTCIFDHVRSLSHQYVAGVFGFSNQSLLISSPTEQIKRINSIDTVPGGLSYLHLESPIRPDHFANPICTQFSDDMEPEDLRRADCRRISLNGTDIKDKRVEIDVVQTQKNKEFAIKTSDQFCQESDQSFIYCTNDGAAWYFLGFIQNLNEKQCLDDKFIKLFNPFYGTEAAKTLDILKSPPNQNVQPPKCQGVRCSFGNCIEKNHVCDNIAECSDGEDEKRCSRHYLGIKSSGDEDNYIDEVESNDSLPFRNISDCPVGHFRCRSTGNCIPISTWCDGVFDCGTDDFTDEPDEAECSCRHYLAIAAPERICDAVIHCPNREDETEICPCSQNSFYCNNKTELSSSTKCINQAFVCDGFKDCESGEDEGHCFDLSTSLLQLEPSTDPDKVKGYVIVKLNGIWHPYCSNIWSQELGNLICSNLNSNIKLEFDSLETFDITRFNTENLLLVTDEYNNGEAYRVVNITETDLFSTEEQLDGISCELGYVKCIPLEQTEQRIN